MKKIALVISPNYKDYAKKYLKECMESIRAQVFDEEIKVFITDNETSPESYKLLRELAPEAELVLNKGNDGFAKGCNDSIRLALQETFDYIMLINMDTVCDKYMLRNIIEYAERTPDTAIIQARVMLYDKPERVNTIGNETHFLGFGYGNGYNKKWSEIMNDVKDEIFYPSGSAILIRAESLNEIGLFDEKMWMYNEDQDLGWKTWLAGHNVKLAKDAVIYHKYEFAKSIKQYYFMDRNRIIEILKNYKFLTLVLIFPAFFVMELGLVLFSLGNGWFKEKLKVWSFFFRPSTWIYLYRERLKTKEIRKIKDRDILKLMQGEIKFQEINDWKLKLANPVLRCYFSILKIVVFW